MSLFDLPTKDTPLGPKNSGVAAFDKMIVQPVSQPGGVRALTPGETVTFNWRSDSSKWTNYKECRFACRWEIRVGPAAGGAGAALTRAQLPPNLRFSACPNTAAFGGGCKYTLNSTVINNCPGTYYEHAMANLWQKQDGSGETAGSNALLTRDKRLRELMDTNEGAKEFNTMSSGSQRLPSKQAMLRLATPVAAAQFGNFEVEIEDLIHVSAFQTGQLAPPGDHSLEFTVAQFPGEDLFFSQTISSLDVAGAIQAQPAYTAVQIVGSNGFPAVGAYAAGTVYACLRHCELHVAYASPQMPIIPSSVQQRLSSMQVLTRAIDSSNVQIQTTVPPSTRQVWIGLRQNHHDIRMDREEMGKAIWTDEYGLTQAGGAGAAATRTYGWSQFQMRMGTSSAPNIPYSNLSIESGKYSRVFNDALSCVGKVNGLRSTEWSFDEFCGQTSANGAVYPAGAAADLAGKVFGDVGGLIMQRLITPPGSRDNTLYIDGQLHGYNPGALQELVIICIYEELVTQEFAPPQELPISTTRVHVI